MPGHPAYLAIATVFADHSKICTRSGQLCACHMATAYAGHVFVASNRKPFAGLLRPVKDHTSIMAHLRV